MGDFSSFDGSSELLFFSAGVGSVISTSKELERVTFCSKVSVPGCRRLSLAMAVSVSFSPLCIILSIIAVL